VTEGNDTPLTNAAEQEHWEEADYSWSEHHKCVPSELARKLERAVNLLRLADDMWAFSHANQTRGVWDMKWNAKRVKLLQEIDDGC